MLIWHAVNLLHPFWFLDNSGCLLESASIRCQKNIVRHVMSSASKRADVLQTYVCVWTLVSSGTGEGDEFMAPFVDHKTAHCGEKEERDVSLTVSHTLVPHLRASFDWEEHQNRECLLE